MSDHRHRRLVEQVAGVNYAAREAGAFTVGSYLFAEREHEVELREAGLRMFRPGPQALECDRGDVVVLDRKRDLEQRVVRGRPHRVDHLNNPLERHVLVRERGQVRIPDPGHQPGMSVPAPSLASKADSDACSTMKTVAPWSWASVRSRRCRSASNSSSTDPLPSPRPG